MCIAEFWCIKEKIDMVVFNILGNMPAGITTWQFNFKFNLTEDMYAEDSVDLLQNSGIRFEKHERDGIETIHFAEMLLVSGTSLPLYGSIGISFEYRKNAPGCRVWS